MKELNFCSTPTYLVNNKLLIQWGQFSVDDTYYEVTFPITYQTNTSYQILGQDAYVREISQIPQVYCWAVNIARKLNSSCRFIASQDIGRFMWVSIGF